MHNVLVDLHRLGGNKYNGLYHFCYQLGLHMAAADPGELDLHFYLPKAQKGIFGNRVSYAAQTGLDKYFLFGTGKFAVWHVATTLSWYRPFNKKTKNVFTIHDLNFLEEDYSNARNRKYLSLIQKRVDRADHLTFISRFARRQAEEHLQLHDTPYSIIYNGCNIPELSAITEPSYHPGTAFLFTIGQLHSRKNFHVLPALLVGNDYKLIIAGLNNFPYAEKVISEAKKHAVEDRVKLVGAVTDAEKSWYYQNCDAFVFPSTGEGFGLPVAEAMYFGKPVFLSSYTSLPEVGGDAACYFSDFDPAAMRSVFEKGMNDYTTYKRAEKIRQQANKFDWNKTAAEYLAIYRKLV